MAVEIQDLNTLQATYKAAVAHWIELIRAEEALASVEHSEAKLDAWEEAGFEEEDARDLAKAAKEAYEDALRETMFNF